MKRAGTFLVYLNDVAEGGETIFPYALGNLTATNEFSSVPVRKPELSEICHKESILKVRPRKGQCLLFHNHLSDSEVGGLDPLAVHGSCPVELGEKWIAQIWLHDVPWGEGVTDFWL